ncbi:MAG: aspartate/tyrosine/aromatic aminotransferase [Devosia sp.]|nr:aspartate/tyrosine/aromatic aminotransferase [Devosia sp.]
MSERREPSAPASLFGLVQPYAGDPILSLFEAFGADPRPDKINLGIGVYTDDQGRIPVLQSVLSAYERIGFGPQPYLPMEGHEGYRSAVRGLVFGHDHPAVEDDRVATIQTIGGTGALSVAADFLARHCPDRMVYVSDPGWDNHHGLFQRAGLRTTSYPYWSEERHAIAFERMKETLAQANDGSIVVIQPVCHNPTGADLSLEQEEELTAVLLQKRHLVVFDMAYQGFGVGVSEDAGFVRRFAAKSQCLIANSFSKNFSLYGQRCGGLSIVCGDTDEARRTLGQLKLVVRRSYSSPPATGGHLVAEILNAPVLREQWEAEVAGMRRRMQAMRSQLADAIEGLHDGFDTQFLREQRGMFSYTGLSAERVRQTRERDGVYLVENGRICVAGLTDGNITAVAKCLARLHSA